MSVCKHLVENVEEKVGEKVGEKVEVVFNKFVCRLVVCATPLSLLFISIFFTPHSFLT